MTCKTKDIAGLAVANVTDAACGPAAAFQAGSVGPENINHIKPH